MELLKVVPWGRSLNEYRDMFCLSELDFSKQILGCGDGPACFNAEWSRIGGSVISVDPIYEFNVAEIRSRIDEVYPQIIDQVSKNKNDFVWKNNRRRHLEKLDTFDLIRKFGPDYKLIFVGDATMSPYEILAPHGSVEYSNTEAGAVWINRMLDHFHHTIWLNPEPESVWQYRQSVGIMQDLVKRKMYPVTLNGLELAMRELSK